MDLDFDPPTRADKLDRQLAAERRAMDVFEAKKRVRAKIRDEQAKAWFDQLPKILGPEPEMDDAEGWFRRRMRLLELAQVEGIGLNVQGVKNYADECARNAAVAAPARYGRTPTGVGLQGDGGTSVAVQVVFVAPQAISDD